MANTRWTSGMQVILTWLKKLLAGNPFYLVSAALLLFGLNRLVVDPHFLGSATPKLIFTFSALQVYEVLLAGVAILLACRRIWYDAALLLVLESALLLVPFILMTEAVVTGQGLARAFCAAGAALAVLRYGSLRSLIPEWNMPFGWLGCGGLILTANLALPFIFRPIMELDVSDWERPSHFVWLIILPLLQFTAILLPRVSSSGDHPIQRSWLPLLMFTLWICASGAHLWCIGYVCNLHLQPFLLAPVLWAAAWTLCRRIKDIVPEPQPILRESLLGLPLLAAWAAVGVGHVLLPLMALNGIFYGGWSLLRRSRAAAVLMQVSLLIFLGSMPQSWVLFAPAEFGRQGLVLLIVLGWSLIYATMQRHPGFGMAGSVIAVMTLAVFFEVRSLHWLLQGGLVYLLLHSLRWPPERARWTQIVLTMASLLWVADSFAWTFKPAAGAVWIVSFQAALVLACCGLVGLRNRFMNRWIQSASALLSLSAAPVNWLLIALGSAHPGVVAVVVSFLLFGCGTALAINRARWGVESQ